MVFYVSSQAVTAAGGLFGGMEGKSEVSSMQYGLVLVSQVLGKGSGSIVICGGTLEVQSTLSECLVSDGGAPVDGGAYKLISC